VINPIHLPTHKKWKASGIVAVAAGPAALTLSPWQHATWQSCPPLWIGLRRSEGVIVVNINEHSNESEAQSHKNEHKTRENRESWRLLCKGRRSGIGQIRLQRHRPEYKIIMQLLEHALQLITPLV
jgi:hypothetical protein